MFWEKMVTERFSRNMHAGNVGGILERLWNRKKSSVEVETVGIYMYMKLL